MAWTNTRAKLANELRRNPDADVTDLRRQLKAERLEDHVKRVLDAAPPLTSAQRDRLAALLASGAAPTGSRV